MKDDLEKQLRRDFLNKMSEDIRNRLVDSGAIIKVSLAGHIDIDGCDPALIQEAFDYWTNLD
jgi:hypothetical protein